MSQGAADRVSSLSDFARFNRSRLKYSVRDGGSMKLEIRDTKQTQNSKSKCPNDPQQTRAVNESDRSPTREFWTLSFGHLNLFRVSGFGFRISDPTTGATPW